MGQLSTNVLHGGDRQLRDAFVTIVGEGDMRRLVVAANRVSEVDSQAAGGLAACILDDLRERGGAWFGWNGEIVASEHDISVACTRCDNVTLVTMPLTEEDYREFYLGFCNGALWPVHHYRLDLARFTKKTGRHIEGST